MIPKTIHYIWFGKGEMPGHVQRTVSGWKALMPDYEFIEWNETNFDVSQHPWMLKMHRERKWAFASDWARIKILKEFGGIYLDIDVEIKKPFDPFLHHRMFWGFEYETYLATCVIGSEPGHPFLDSILSNYDGMEDAVVNNVTVTQLFLDHFEGFRLNNARHSLPAGIEVYPKEYFSVPTHAPAAGFCRHHATNLWIGDIHSSPIKKIVRRILGEVIYYKLVAWKVNRKSQFRDIYLRDKKGRHSDDPV